MEEETAVETAVETARKSDETQMVRGLKKEESSVGCVAFKNA
ncbi:MULTISPECIES: hypothetical protein [unclassified Microcoleus]|nr:MULTISPECIES: hypothetical protein [unclassified Microcoleus]